MKKVRVNSGLFRLMEGRSGRLQCLTQVVNQVFNILYADAETKSCTGRPSIESVS